MRNEQWQFNERRDDASRREPIAREQPGEWRAEQDRDHGGRGGRDRGKGERVLQLGVRHQLAHSRHAAAQEQRAHGKDEQPDK